MTIWVVHCIDGPDVADLRAATGADHSAYLLDAAVTLLLYGPLVPGAAEPGGSVFVVEAADRGVVEAFHKGDPFASAGVWREVHIHEFRPSPRSVLSPPPATL
jgi:uncharacterized protein